MRCDVGPHDRFRGDLPPSAGASEPAIQRPKEALMTNSQAMSCPVCRVPLTMSERQGVEIDYCPQCRGVWLDRGELDKILERQAAFEQQQQDVRPQQPPNPAAAYPPPPPYGHPQQPPPYGGGRHYDDDDRYKHGYYKRKKSWLAEIFD